MEETRKHILLIAASILAAPMLASQIDSKTSPARDHLIAEAVRDAEQILRTIENLHPST
jgi:hypothetical protein